MSTFQTFSAHRGWASALSAAGDDFAGGLKRWELWLALGWHDIRQRYRRSIVGPFWLTLSMGMMVGGLAYLYSGLFGQSVQQYLPYVAVGMIVFNLISSIITESPAVFISSARTILQTRAPLSIYVYQMLWRCVLIFLHNMCIYLILIPFFDFKLGMVTLLALPGLFFIVLIGFWSGIVLGGLSARFRDVPPIVASVMQIAFFLTPIFWTTGSLRGREAFIHFNPFYYLLEAVRMPLLGEAPPPAIWLGVIAMSVAGGIVALIFFARYRARVAYWI
jgi:ABC-2 type transport system permease protein/lipopolysaccharide transport system permease protein